MAFSGMILTAKGRDLQAKVQAGATLTFTKIKVGDGNLPPGVSLESFNDLIGPQLVVPIQDVSVIGDGTCRVRGVLTNTGLETGFFVREIGVFATDPDLGEILYAVANAGDECDYLPAGGGAVAIEHVLDIVMSIENAASVTAIINESAVLATKADLSAHIGTGGNAHAVATPTLAGFMGGADKAKLDGINAESLSAAVTIHKTVTPLDHPDGSVTAAKLAPGVALTNLGYTPLDKAGDSMTGALVLAGDPTADLHPVTRQYGVANYAPAGYGLGTTFETQGDVPNGADLNTAVTKTGFYYAISCANRPSGVSNGYLAAEVYDESDQRQQFVDATSGAVYVRYKAAGTWQAWKQIVTTDQQYIIATGTVANGGTIPLPAGCSTCLGIIVSINKSMDSQVLWDVNEGGAAVGMQDVCSVNQTTRVVTVGVWNSYSYSFGWYPGTANYMIIGVV